MSESYGPERLDGTPLPGHLDPVALGDLADGLLAPEKVARVRAHLGSCADCAELDHDLRKVRDLLRALPAPGPLPPDVASRLRAALADAAREHGGGSPTGARPLVPAAPAGAPVPSRGGARALDGLVPPEAPASLQGVRARRDQRARRARAALAGVAAVAAAAVAVPVLDDLGAGGEDQAASTAGGSAASAYDTVVLETRSDYRADDLAAAAVALTATVPASGDVGDAGPGAEDERDDGAAAGAAPGTAVPATPGGADEPRATELSGRALLDRLRQPDALAGCAAALAEVEPPVTGTPVAVDLARYEGVPAAVLVAPSDDPGAWAVHVVGPGCGLGTPEVLASSSVPR